MPPKKKPRGGHRSNGKGVDDPPILPEAWPGTSDPFFRGEPRSSYVSPGTEQGLHEPDNTGGIPEGPPVSPSVSSSFTSASAGCPTSIPTADPGYSEESYVNVADQTSSYAYTEVDAQQQSLPPSWGARQTVYDNQQDSRYAVGESSHPLQQGAGYVQQQQGSYSDGNQASGDYTQSEKHRSKKKGKGRSGPAQRQGASDFDSQEGYHYDDQRSPYYDTQQTSDYYSQGVAEDMSGVYPQGSHRSEAESTGRLYDEGKDAFYNVAASSGAGPESGYGDPAGPSVPHAAESFSENPSYGTVGDEYDTPFNPVAGTHSSPSQTRGKTSTPRRGTYNQGIESSSATQQHQPYQTSGTTAEDYYGGQQATARYNEDQGVEEINTLLQGYALREQNTAEPEGDRGYQQENTGDTERQGDADYAAGSFAEQAGDASTGPETEQFWIYLYDVNNQPVPVKYLMDYVATDSVISKRLADYLRLQVVKSSTKSLGITHVKNKTEVKGEVKVKIEGKVEIPWSEPDSEVPASGTTHFYVSESSKLAFDAHLSRSLWDTNEVTLQHGKHRKGERDENRSDKNGKKDKRDERRDEKDRHRKR